MLTNTRYSIPAHIKQHVDYVTPGLKLLAGGKGSTSTMMKRNNIPIVGPIIEHLQNKTKAVELTECDQYITPPCIAAMYNITQATKAAPGNQLGIFEEGDYYDAESLVAFFATFAQNIPILTQPIVKGIDGGIAPGAFATGESDLDLQISYPIIYPQNSVIFQTDDINYASGIEGGGGFLNTFFDAIDGSYCTYSAYGETVSTSFAFCSCDRPQIGISQLELLG